MREISDRELTLEIGREFNRIKKLAFPDDVFQKAKTWRASDSGKASFRKYKKSDKGRSVSKRYNNSPARVEYMRRYGAKLDPKVQKLRLAEWSRNNPDKVAARFARYRARKRNVFVPGFEIAVSAIYERAKILRQWFDVVVDHICPISRGGTHHPENLQIIYRHDNVRKGARSDYSPSVIFT